MSQLPPLPPHDIADPHRFGVAWREQSILAYAQKAVDEAVAAEREAIMDLIDQWCKPSQMRLFAGEMSLSELRTAQSVLTGVMAAIRARSKT